ncbi:MAG: Tat pathway signal protein [Deltaproteobacteria bacterium]|nr:Tat pathway signal protein [Deltaproteobacteria bacterium]
MEMNRRAFIRKSLGAGVLALGAGPLLSSCSGVRRVSFKPSEFPIEEIPDLDDQSVAILYYASLAPSGHNTQPWYVKRTGRFDWVIGADPARKLPAVDPQNRELLLSIGAFVENLSLAAGVYGYEMQAKITASNPADPEILRIFLKREKVNEYPLTKITSRRTVRNGFKPAEIRKNDLEKLGKPLEGNFFYFPRSSEHGKCLAERAIESFRDQTNRDEAQRELASWIRFSDKEAKKYRDGLTAESMEITGISGWWVRRFWGPKDVMKKGFRKKGIDGTARIAREGSGWVIVTSPGEKVSDLIETGRNFEKMFLLARDLKIAIHPMTQMLEEEKWRNEIGQQHGPKMIPQFVLRIGYLDKYPEPVSLRRPVSWFLKV